MDSHLTRAFSVLAAKKFSPSDDMAFKGVPLRDDGTQHVAIDRSGNPVILIATEKESGNYHPMPVSLANISAEYGRVCEIGQVSGSKIRGTFAIITCVSRDPTLREYYFFVMDGLLSRLPSKPSLDDISFLIRGVIELFKSASQVTPNKAMGLWAELYLIAKSHSPIVAISAWHKDPLDRFDFVLANQIVEVKSAGDRHRSHYFSYEQAYPPAAATSLVASLFVEPGSTSITVGELWDAVRDMAGNDVRARLRVDEVCMGTLGNAWISARERAFSADIAKESLRYFDLTKIPKVPEIDHPGITEIEFRSNLEFIDSLDIATVAVNNTLFGALPTSSTVSPS